jgi:hypothetical protein
MVGTVNSHQRARTCPKHVNCIIVLFHLCKKSTKNTVEHIREYYRVYVSNNHFITLTLVMLSRYRAVYMTFSNRGTEHCHRQTHTLMSCFHRMSCTSTAVLEVKLMWKSVKKFGREAF